MLCFLMYDWGRHSGQRLTSPCGWHNTPYFLNNYHWRVERGMSDESMKDSFCKGQRWVSETEPELGLGILSSFDPRTITLHFPGSDCARKYSRAAAPVKRMRFQPGDRITAEDGTQMTVEKVEENDGILTMSKGKKLFEYDLSSVLDIDMPFSKLLSGLAGASAG